MNNTKLQKKLENLELPDIELKEHKKKLKIFLTKRQFNTSQKGKKHTAQKTKKQFWGGLNIFHNNQILLKKIFPALGVVFVVLILLFVQVPFKPSEVANANEIIDKAIITLQNAPNRDEKTETILTALQEAQKSKNLEYLGEEIVNNKKVKKFRFIDEETLPFIIIRVDPEDTSANAVSVSFSTENIASESVEFEVKDNQVIQPEILEKKLSDNSIQKAWIKNLIQQNNLKFFESNATAITMNEELTKTVKPYVQSAEVVITSFGVAHDEVHNVYLMSMRVYAVGKQKENRRKALEYVDQAINLLQSVDSTQVRNKIFLLEKAKQSKDLKYFPRSEKEATQSIKLSFIDAELRDKEIIILLDLENFKNPTEEAVQFYALGVSASRVEGSMQNGKIIIDNHVFKDSKLNKNPYKDLILETIIHPQNKKLYNELLNDPQFSKDFLEKVQPIFITSERLINGFPYVDKDNQGNIVSFTVALQSFKE